MAKVAVVFGGTLGIGRAVAAKFIHNDFNTVILSRSSNNIEEALHFLRSLLNSNKHSVEGLQCDINDENAVKKCCSYVEEKIGPTSIIVNTVGININQLLVQTSSSNMKSVLETNLLSSMNLSKIFLKPMMKRRTGSIVNIGSIIGLKGNVGQTLYSASKSGLVGFTKSLAREVASRNITVNLVMPGFIKTEMTANLDLDKIKPFIPLKRTGTPDEVAEAVYFLATSPFITGEVLVVDGGLQLSF